MEETVIQPMPHTHPIVDDDPHFIINPDTREITHASPEKLVLIQGDHMSERYTFELPKTVDGHDMSLCNDIQIHFINVNGSNSAETSKSVYGVVDFGPKDGDDETLEFSWLISQHATLFAGALSFAVRFICRDENNQIQYVWNTAPFSGVTISTGIDNGQDMADNTYYNTILETWYNDLVYAGTTSVEAIEEAKNKVVEEDIPAAKDKAIKEVDDHVETAAFEYVERVKESVPTEVLNLKNILVQERGYNPDRIMSQKGVSNALDSLETDYEEKVLESRNEFLSKFDEFKNSVSSSIADLGYVEVPNTYDYGGYDPSNFAPNLSEYVLFKGKEDFIKNSPYTYYINGWYPDEVSASETSNRREKSELIFRINVTVGASEASAQVEPRSISVDISSLVPEVEDYLYNYSDDNILESHISNIGFRLKVYGFTVEQAINNPEMVGRLQIHMSINDREFTLDPEISNLGNISGNAVARVDMSTFECIVKNVMYPVRKMVGYAGESSSALIQPISIVDVRKTATNGLMDTYTISLSNGSTRTFELRNGNGINEIYMLNRGDYEDLYEIDFTNGTSTTFTVPNGGSVGIKRTATGEVVSVNDVSPIEHGVKVKVKSKNLLSHPYYPFSTERVGVTITGNNDGSITLNGTSTSSWNIALFGNETATTTLPAGTYTVSLKNGDIDKCYMVVGGNSSAIEYSYGTSVTFTLNEDGPIGYCVIQIRGGATFDNLTVYPQLELGSTATEYTPYVEPTLMKVYTCGKNILRQPYQTATRTLNGITIVENDDGSFTANGMATSECIWFLLDNGTERLKGTYTFSGVSGGSATTYYAQMVVDGVYQGAITETTTCQIDGVLTRVGFYVKTGTVLDNVTFKLQLESGDTATEYEPYDAKSSVHIPNHDGTVHGVTSISPNMTIFTDTAGAIVEAEYNENIHSYVENAVGDMDAALDAINATLDELIGGLEE